MTPPPPSISSLASADGSIDASTQACIRGGQPKTALEVYDQLTTKGGVTADKVIYTLVVQARAMMGEFDEAFQVITVSGIQVRVAN